MCIIQELRMMMFEMLCFPFSCKTASIPSAIHGSMFVSITSYTTQNQELPDLLTSRSDILLRIELEESPTSDPSCRGHNSTENRNMLDFSGHVKSSSSPLIANMITTKIPWSVMELIHGFFRSPPISHNDENSSQSFLQGCVFGETSV